MSFAMHQVSPTKVEMKATQIHKKESQMHLANITYRLAEVEYYTLLYYLQWQFDYSPRHFQTMLVQQQHVPIDLEKEADQFFSLVLGNMIMHTSQAWGK